MISDRKRGLCYDAHILHWGGENPLTQNSKSDTPSSFLFIENRMFFMFILNCIKYKVKIRLSINIVEHMSHYVTCHHKKQQWLYSSYYFLLQEVGSTYYLEVHTSEVLYYWLYILYWLYYF